MKIGVLFSAYNSEGYIDECLSPWFKLKNEFNITIGCNSGMYSDYNYFIYPSSTQFNEIPNFNKFRIEVLKDNTIIHNEFIHIKHE